MLHKIELGKRQQKFFVLVKQVPHFRNQKSRNVFEIGTPAAVRKERRMSIIRTTIFKKRGVKNESKNDQTNVNSFPPGSSRDVVVPNGFLISIH